MRIEVSELPEGMAELCLKARFYDIVILKGGQPWVKFTKHDGYRPKVRMGPFPELFKDGYKVPDDFGDTPEDIIEDFYKQA